MQIYGLKNCDTCRKAKKALGEVALQDVRVDGVPDKVLAEALVQFGAALVNTRSTTWRGLSEIERAKAPLDLLVDNPALMKRPLIVDGAQMYLGWTDDVKAALGAA